MSDDNVLYAGPSEEYVPGLGRNQNTRSRSRDVTPEYADPNHLKDVLEIIQNETNDIISKAEQELSTLSLKVEEDSKLQEAHAVEWPADLGDPKGHISYLQYKALGNRDTRSATYIRRTYEDSLRGPSGTNAIDVLNMAKALQSEATNIGEFLDDSIGNVSDDSEKRTVEMLQDWAENAVFHTRNIRGLIEKREPQTKISAAELDLLDSSRAAQYQALFKVKLNAINNEIAQIQDDIKKDHGEHSDAYFKKFLGPAMKFRLNATKGMEEPLRSSGEGRLLAESRSGSAMNANLAVLMSDQTKRNTAFETKFTQLEERIKARDNYIGYIKQLEDKGRKIKVAFTDATVEEEERVAWEEMLADTSTTNKFKSDHALLHGVDDDDAHGQYLLKAGGTITGDIELAELTDEDGNPISITTDGMVPSTHTHTGQDGTQKIHGSNILGGINNDHIDTDDAPDRPTNLTVVSLTPKTAPPGGTTVDALVSWDGPENCTFEFQIVRVL